MNNPASFSERNRQGHEVVMTDEAGGTVSIDEVRDWRVYSRHWVNVWEQMMENEDFLETNINSDMITLHLYIIGERCP